MIFYFCNYLALLAAIYFSMCLDKVLTKHIWTNDYFSNFEGAIKHSSTIVASIADNIIASSKKDVNDIQSVLIKKSVYMLSLVTLVLAYCGYEQNIGVNTEQQQSIIMQLHAAIAETALISFVLFNLLFSKHVYTKWGWTCAAIISNLVIFFSLLKWGNAIVPNTVTDVIVGNANTIVLLFFTLPVLWQIWVCFVYRSIYPIYINGAICRIGTKYKKAQDCLESEDHENMPTEYKNVMGKLTIQGKDKTVKEVLDASLDEFVAVLQNDIQNAGVNLNEHQIFWRFVAQKCKNGKDAVLGRFNRDIKKNTTNIHPVGVSNENVSDKDTIVRYAFDTLIAEYLTSGMSLEDFCNEKKISKDEFEKQLNKVK